MATSKTISAALKLVDTKKENLKKAYDDLQAHSSLLSSSLLPLSWSHLDSHFTSLHNSLTQRFLHLQSLESQPHNNNNPNNDPSPSPSKLPYPDPKVPNFPSFPNDPSSSSTQNGTVSALPMSHAEALSALCKKMDGKGLRTYVVEHLKDKAVIKDELQSALKCASDPAAMVLDAMDGVVGANAMKDEKDLRLIKRSCNVLFQQLRAVNPYLSVEARKRAKRLFLEWKGSLVIEHNADAMWAMAFLHFVAAFGLLDELTVNELATFSAMAAVNDELPQLYQIIGLSDKVPGLVQSPT